MTGWTDGARLQKESSNQDIKASNTLAISIMNTMVGNHSTVCVMALCRVLGFFVRDAAKEPEELYYQVCRLIAYHGKINEGDGHEDQDH